MSIFIWIVLISSFIGSILGVISALIDELDTNNKIIKFGVKLYKAKIKYYFAYSYLEEIVHITANNIEEAINKLHNKYDYERKNVGFDWEAPTKHPAFIVKIKEVK